MKRVCLLRLLATTAHAGIESLVNGDVWKVQSDDFVAAHRELREVSDD